MDWSFSFFFSSLVTGVGLAMDAFSVSLANGFNEPKMKKRRMLMIAGTFAFFQALMPFLGWICVHTMVQHFQSFEKFIPWIAMGLLCAIGGKMIWDGIHEKECHCSEGEMTKLCWTSLLLQGVATSIDALSVGFQIASYNLLQALVCALLIAAVTFVICLGGVVIGRKFGTAFAGTAGIFGGCILVFIGICIFVRGML